MMQWPGHLLRAVAGSSQSQPIVDFLLPWRCVLCGSRTQREACGFCSDCRAALTTKNAIECERCGATVGLYTSTTEGCVHCRGRPFRFEAARSLGTYDELLKTAIVRSKWSYSSSTMLSLGRLLAEQHRDWLADLGLDRIIPIPQSWTTRLTRHFNSAGILGEQIAHDQRLSFDQHILCRSRWTPPQKRIAVSKRYDNQNGSFRVQDAHIIKGRRLLLVDDVMTTGATCTAAARTLKSAGARQVHVLVAARVLDSQ